MSSQKGFIQIPILIAIVIGVIVVGGASYIGIWQYQSHQTNNTQRQENTVAHNEQTTSTQDVSEVEKLRQEVKELEKQQLFSPKPQTQSPASKKEVIDTTPINKILDAKQIFQKVSPGVVFIESNYKSGSGMIIEDSGLVLTNAHVVEGLTSVTITLKDKEKFSAHVVGRNEKVDVALLQIEASSKHFSIVDLGDSTPSSIEQGDVIYALGFPFGFSDQTTITQGILSARQFLGGMEYLQIDLAILPGNSGGPLINRYGKVVGISTLIIDPVKIGEYLKFALPINAAKILLVDLKSGNNVVADNDFPPQKRKELQVSMTVLENQLLDNNQFVQVLVEDDHALHVEHESDGIDTPARRAHLAAHGFAISTFERQPEILTPSDIIRYYNGITEHFSKLTDCIKFRIAKCYLEWE